MLTPEGENIGLDGATGRAIVVKAGDPTIDLEGGYVKEAPLKGVDQGLAEGIPTERVIVAVSEGGLQLLLNGSLLKLQGVELLDGGVDRILGSAGGLEIPDGAALGVDGGLFLG